MSAIIHFQKRSLVVADPAMESTITMALRAARTHFPVFLNGESGTGKELVARFIHEKSKRSHGPFVSVNCAAVPEGLMEAEFFGFERGAFTGAIAQRIGKFERANGGTLLLDEISEMPFSLQAKLLRVLQEGEIDRLGGRDPIPLNCRIIATTNRCPIALIRENKFREDLYYRLNVVRIDCAPLRNRNQAILCLARQFLTQACETQGFGSSQFSKAAEDKLQTYPWPGNVRELQNAVERAVLIAEGGVIGEDHLRHLESVEDAQSETTPVNLALLERQHILKTLDRTQGSRTVAADLLGISTRTLRNKLKEYGK